MKNYRFSTLLSLTLILAAFGVNRLSAQEQETTTVGGYGELHYNEPDGITRGTLDFHRFVFYLAHTFNDKLSLKSETEIEHTKIEGGQGGEVALEQAYLDWHFDKSIGMKAGILLVPVGIINQYHEPPTFNGVERPSIDRNVIPATWRESGAGIYGTLSEGLNYQLYLMAGVLASGFTGDQGIYEGKQEALESSTMNPSLTGRLEYVPLPELKVGGSFFLGNSTDGDEALGSGNVRLIAGDAQYSVDQFAFRGEAAFIGIGDAEKINAAFHNDVADQIYGFYLEGAYNIMPFVAADAADQTLRPFIRYEKYNTQASVTGFTANPANNRNNVVIGATYKPTYNTAFKLDYQFLNNETGINTRQFNMGIGFNF